MTGAFEALGSIRYLHPIYLNLGTVHTLLSSLPIGKVSATMPETRIVVPSTSLPRSLAIISGSFALPQRSYQYYVLSNGGRRYAHRQVNRSVPGVFKRSCLQELERLRWPLEHTLCAPPYPCIRCAQVSTSALPTLDTTNYYTLFPDTLQQGVPPTGPFVIDANQLRKEYLRLQSVHHPDKYPPDQKRQADALSALLGEAFRTLTDPLRCAQYLLLMKYNVDMNSESAKSSATDMEMLSTIIEAQEAATDASTQAEIDALNAENERRIEGCVSGLAQAFRDDDAAKARTECTQLKYWTSLRDALRNWEPGKEVRLEH